MKSNLRWLLLSALGLVAGLLVTSSGGAAPLAGATGPGSPREKLRMDLAWRFHLGNEWGIGQNLAKAGSGIGPASVAFSDASWRTVNLPHDWAVELPFDRDGDASHGFKALGEAYPQNSVGWYRRTFDLPGSDRGRRIWLAFDGVFRDATVFVNGWFVGHHESGYSSFRYDITDVAECGGENVVAVRVDAAQTEGWFYEGAGIYRHVWLEKTAPVAVAPDGVFVRAEFKDNIPSGPAPLKFETRLLNSTNAPAATLVTWQVYGPDGREVATARQAANVPAVATVTADDGASVNAPQLWSPEHPVLYTLVTTVTRDGTLLDRVETRFGIRTFGFDAEEGFLLNGRPYVIKGACCHQDHAGVGIALADRLQEFRIARLKQMGCNAYRSAHNPATLELIEACDRLGLLVMDESRLLGSDAANLSRLEWMVRRDRSHASVAIWSIANEEFSTQGTPAGRRVAATMQAMIKRLDPSRPVTYNAPVGNEFAGINEIIEVRGWSYRIGIDRMDAYHREHPQQPNVGSEQGSTITTRGIYRTDPERGYMSAYDDNKTDWSNTAKEWWGFFVDRPWLSGGFVWTGFDYRGEPTPYDWPCISSHFGVFDTCGFPKDNFWNYQAWWTDAPMVHLMPHWNWAGREGQAIDVRAMSNCEEVELFLNDRSLGRQKMPPASELKWTVKYAPGTLSARGYRGGKVVATTSVATTGTPAAVRLTAEHPAVVADGEDVAIFSAAIVDAQGRVVPTANRQLTFALTGPGRIIGVGNGDPSCHEPDVFVSSPTMRTIAIGDWRWHDIADPYAVTIPEAAVGFDDSTWTPVDVRAERGPLGPRERALFRATIDVPAEALTASGVELWFGRLNGDGYVFVNGERVGPGGGPNSASLYDVRKILKPGPNTIAVSLANYGTAAGVNQGAALRLVELPRAPVWSRSTFNGLAQIIVRTTKEQGTLQLTARAEGLQPGSVSVAAQATPVSAAAP